MKGTGARNRRVESVLEVGFKQDLERAPARFAFDEAGDDLVRILSQLSRSVDRFETMLHDQRQLLQHVAQLGIFDDDEVQVQSTRIIVRGAEIVATARGALAELQRLSRVTKLAASGTNARHHAHGLGQDQPAG